MAVVARDPRQEVRSYSCVSVARGVFNSSYNWPEDNYLHVIFNK